MTQQQVANDRARWLDTRSAGITASEIASAMGLEPATHASPFALWVAKRTGKDFTPDNDAMMRGRHLEPYVADRYVSENNARVIDGGLYCSRERKWQMATFDRFAVRDSEDMRPVQIKTAVSRYNSEGKLIWGDNGSDDIPVWYRAQCLQEMDVWDTDEVIVPCLFMNNWNLWVYRIHRDKATEADIGYMREAALEFMDRVKNNDPPPIDWTPSTTRALRTLYHGEPQGDVEIPARLARRYRNALRSASKVKRQMGQVNNEILALAGDAREILIKGGPDAGMKVATRTKYQKRTSDTKMLKEKWPGIAKQVERVTDVEALYPGSWSQDK
jgi:putative phage-type endonuclease